MSTSESRKPVDPAAPSQRYLFETSFDTEAVAARDEPAEPTFGIAEIESARQEAYADGEAAGRQEAVNGLEKQLLNGLGRLVEQMTALADDQARYQDGVTQRSVQLALKAIRKLFPALAERDGLVEIETVLADCLREARAEPKIVVRVAEALVDPLQERIVALTASTGHAGEVRVLADASLDLADCRVEWAEGGAERVVQQMWQEFEAATQRIFQGAAGADEALDEAPDAALEVPDDPAVEETAGEAIEPEATIEPQDTLADPLPTDSTSDHALNGSGDAPPLPEGRPADPSTEEPDAIDGAAPQPDPDFSQDNPTAS